MGAFRLSAIWAARLCFVSHIASLPYRVMIDHMRCFPSHQRRQFSTSSSLRVPFATCRVAQCQHQRSGLYCARRGTRCSRASFARPVVVAALALAPSCFAGRRRAGFMPRGFVASPMRIAVVTASPCSAARSAHAGSLRQHSSAMAALASLLASLPSPAPQQGGRGDALS